MPTVNNDIKNLHRLLVDKHEALFKLLGKTADPIAAGALREEMREITRRIDATQRALFVENTAQLTARIKAIPDAATRLDDAIRSATSVASVIRAVSSFLTIVDKAIDVAKLLAVAVA